jgi:hypothetical protein
MTYLGLVLLTVLIGWITAEKAVLVTAGAFGAVVYGFIALILLGVPLALFSGLLWALFAR